MWSHNPRIIKQMLKDKMISILCHSVYTYMYFESIQFFKSNLLSYSKKLIEKKDRREYGNEKYAGIESHTYKFVSFYCIYLIFDFVFCNLIFVLDVVYRTLEKVLFQRHMWHVDSIMASIQSTVKYEFRTKYFSSTKFIQNNFCFLKNVWCCFLEFSKCGVWRRNEALWKSFSTCPRWRTTLLK